MKLKLITLFAIAFMTASCTAITGEDTFRTREIDGCEYLEKYNGYQSGYSFTHKGNCKNPIHYCKPSGLH